MASLQHEVCAHVVHDPRSVNFPEQLPPVVVVVVVVPAPPSDPKTAETHVSISEQPRFTQFCACAMARSL